MKNPVWMNVTSSLFEIIIFHIFFFLCFHLISFLDLDELASTKHFLWNRKSEKKKQILITSFAYKMFDPKKKTKQQRNLHIQWIWYWTESHSQWHRKAKIAPGPWALDIRQQHFKAKPKRKKTNRPELDLNTEHMPRCTIELMWHCIELFVNVKHVTAYIPVDSIFFLEKTQNTKKWSN